MKQLEKFILNCALLEQAPTLDSLKNSALSGNRIYYGTGLATPRAMSVGLPVDVLGMMLLGERISEICEFPQFVHHIADTHAKTNSFADPEEVDRLAQETKRTLGMVSKNLGIKRIKIVMSSEIDTTPDYQAFYKKFRGESKLHEYVVNELCDIAWYKKHMNIETKLGWVIQGSETSIGSDERLFDREYVRITKEQHLFLYAKAGRTFDASRPKASPYIITEGEHRLPLRAGISVQEILDENIKRTGDKDLMGATKHLQSIVRLYEEHAKERFGNIPLHEKLQKIIDKAFLNV